MLKRTIAISIVITVLSFALAMPVFAQVSNSNNCGFWASLFGRCKTGTSEETQSASAIESRLNATSSKPEKNNAATLSSIACVGTAVAVREASLVSGMTSFTQGLNSAYSARATDLASAYAQTTATGVRAGIKVAWTAFNTSTKVAQKAWRTTQSSAWGAFRTAVKSCKGPAVVSDAANSVSEMSGE